MALSTPTFRIYNTLTRSVEPVETTEQTTDGDGRGVPHLRFYGCGPTVYSYAHIGNFRSFLTADLIVRTARALGWQTTYVTNITDVGHLTEDDVADNQGEDRMAKALASKEGERFANVWDLARFYADALVADWHTLNLIEPDVRPRATEHVRQQIQAVERLIEEGHAYETSQGVYFSVERFAAYGRLSGNEAAEALSEGAAAEARDVVQDPEKRDPRDFALWKKDPRHLMQWHSPWGWGFPGWHIECSVMAMEYLGQTIDLHAGGEDLIFPHHECEIAQSESLTGQPFAHHWVHTRFLQVEGEKMSKRKGNFFTVRDILSKAEGDEERTLAALALRLTLISGQYRKPFNYTRRQFDASVKHLERLHEIIGRVRAAVEADAPGDDRVGDRLSGLYDRALQALCDDLNTPAAIAAVLEGAKLLRGLGENLNGASARSARTWLRKVNDLLGIIFPEGHDPLVIHAEGHATIGMRAGAEASADSIPAAAQALATERDAARAERDYARSDALRDELQALGYEVMDTPEGTKLKKRRSL